MKKQIILSVLLLTLLVLVGVQELQAQTVSQGYFVGINGQQRGPYDLNNLRELIQNGTMTRTSLVWKEGMANWVEASTVSEISTLFVSTPPPLPSTAQPLPQTQSGGPVNWTAVSSSTFGSSINGIAWGNNAWVAVGYEGKIAYSSNGRTWTSVPSGTGAGQSTFPSHSGVLANSIWAVAWGNNKFVAGSNYGRLAYSADGRSWTAVADSGFSAGIFGIAWGNNRFVAGGRDGRIAYSADGISWTAVADSTFRNDDIYAFAYGNGRFVAVGDQGRMAYSADGASWTRVANSTFGNDDILAIAWGNNRFVAGGYRGRMAYSADGVSWTAVDMGSIFGTGNFDRISAIAWGNNRFVAVGFEGKMAYSTDGQSWTAVSNNRFGSETIRAVAYGNGRFVAGGYNGRMAYADW